MNLIDSLYKQGCKRIYVAIDFGKFDEIIAKQSEYELLESKYSDKFERFEVWRRTENLGVAASVITAVSNMKFLLLKPAIYSFQLLVCITICVELKIDLIPSAIL
jgi:hypothetical protein